MHEDRICCYNSLIQRKEEQMTRLELSYFGHIMKRLSSLEKSDTEKGERKEGDQHQDGVTQLQ